MVLIYWKFLLFQPPLSLMRCLRVEWVWSRWDDVVVRGRSFAVDLEAVCLSEV